MCFVSPTGRGVDAHRTWEALSLGAIPIVWFTTINGIYTDLPVMVVRNSDEVTKESVTAKYEELHAVPAETYHWEKLFGFWWLQRMEMERRIIWKP